MELPPEQGVAVATTTKQIKAMRETMGAATTVGEEVPGSPKAALSVVMPYYRAGFIGWIPFESLIRQKGIDFNWELIVMEERFDNPVGYTQMAQYWDRLKKVGCCRFKYISLKSWMPLSGKWYFLINSIDENSQVICFNSCDIFMSHKRLAAQSKALDDSGYNWYKLGGNLVYDLASDIHVKLVSITRSRPDTICRAARSDLMKKLSLVWKERTVDSWMYGSLSPYVKFYYDNNDLWKDTVNVTGLNTLTMGRGERVRQVVAPFSECCGSLVNHIPSSVVERLRSCREHLAAHRQLLKKSRKRNRTR